MVGSNDPGKGETSELLGSVIPSKFGDIYLANPHMLMKRTPKRSPSFIGSLNPQVKFCEKVITRFLKHQHQTCVVRFSLCSKAFLLAKHETFLEKIHHQHYVLTWQAVFSTSGMPILMEKRNIQCGVGSPFFNNFRQQYRSHTDRDQDLVSVIVSHSIRFI